MLKPSIGAAQAVDTVSGVAILPTVAGRAGDAPAWFIITESSDSADAARRRVNWAPRLALLRGTAAVQQGRFDGARLTVDAGVDFTPVSRVVANPDSAFPPREAVPGSIAAAGYSPLVELANGIVLNAAVIASDEGRLDRVVQLDKGLAFAVVRISRGYAEGRTAWYISTEASDPMVAAMEGATYMASLGALSAGAAAPALPNARLGLVAIVNGPLRSESPAERHGLRSALSGEGDPQSVLERAPSSREYSPLWDMHVAVWSPRAVRDSERVRLLGFSEVEQRVAGGVLGRMGGSVVHPSLGGLTAMGIVVNCPVLAVF
jgi:hypothetical protein